MKFRIFSLCAFLAVISMSACHFGADAIKEDIKRNEEYKGIRAEREAATALPDSAVEKMGGATAPATTTVAADTVAAK